MTDKELKKLSRTDLLELLVEQGKQLEELQNKYAELEQRFEERRIEMKNAGSIADAAMRINDIFNVAQRTANDYIANVKNNDCTLDLTSLKENTQKECDILLKDAQKKCDNLLKGAQEECDNLRKNAQKDCDILRENTQEECNKIKKSTREKCEATLKTFTQKIEAFL